MARAGHESWVLGVTVHPEGAAFATCSSDAKVKLWDLQSRACVQTLAEHSDQAPPHPPDADLLNTSHPAAMRVRSCGLVCFGAWRPRCVLICARMATAGLECRVQGRRDEVSHCVRRQISGAVRLRVEGLGRRAELITARVGPQIRFGLVTGKGFKAAQATDRQTSSTALRA